MIMNKTTDTKESRTYRFVRVSFWVIVWAFVINQISQWAYAFGIAPNKIEAISIAAFGGGIALVLSIWLGREVKEKYFNNGVDSG